MLKGNTGQDVYLQSLANIATPVPSRHNGERPQAGMQAQLGTLKRQMSLWFVKYTVEDMIQNHPLTIKCGDLTLNESDRKSFEVS